MSGAHTHVDCMHPTPYVSAESTKEDGLDRPEQLLIHVRFIRVVLAQTRVLLDSFVGSADDIIQQILLQLAV